MLSRALTTACSIATISGDMLSLANRSSIGWRLLPKRRIEREGPSIASGGMIALIRIRRAGARQPSATIHRLAARPATRSGR